MSDFEQWALNNGYCHRDLIKNANGDYCTPMAVHGFKAFNGAIASMQGEAKFNATEDADRLRSVARGMSYNDMSEATWKHVILEIAMRLDTGGYTPSSASAEIARLTKELEEARKDAERYRWLLDNCQFQEPDGCLSLHFKTDRPAKMRPAGLRHFWINEDIGTAIKNHNHKKETL